jgi:hypothetical protein
VRKLWSGISSEVADATGMAIDGSAQFFRTDPFSIPNPLSMCPVLAEKTIKRASVIENGEVLKAIFWTGAVSKFWIPGTGSTWTDPIGYTIGGQSIIIPTGISFSLGDSVKDSLFLSP